MNILISELYIALILWPYAMVAKQSKVSTEEMIHIKQLHLDNNHSLHRRRSNPSSDVPENCVSLPHLPLSEGCFWPQGS